MASSQPNAFAPSADPTAYGQFRSQLLETFPWLHPWLQTDPAAGPVGLMPRDYIRTPFALSLLDIEPQNARFLDEALTPWMATRRVLQLYYERQTHLLRGLPLQLAILRNDVQGIAQMVMQETTSIHALAAHGHTPLTFAALLGRMEVVVLLLVRGVDLNAPDRLGNTALHWASIMRDRRMCECLLAAGAKRDANNLLGGQPDDYEAAWNNVPPASIEVHALHRDGSKQLITDSVTFREALGFDYNPRVRPGIDFYVQLATGMADGNWLEAVIADLQQLPAFARDEFPEVPMFFKDFGDPWGWGVCAAEAVKTGQPVGTYEGDLVHTWETMVDLLNAGLNPYISNAQPSKKLQGLFRTHFDAWRCGNFGTRINCAPYDGAQNLGFTCRFWRGLPRCQFFASRDIEASEQLSWYYGDGYWKIRGIPAQALPRF